MFTVIWTDCIEISKVFHEDEDYPLSIAWATSNTAFAYNLTDASYIRIMGPTGTGKTSLINMISGYNIRIGREIESCTRDVEVDKLFDLDGRMI